MRWKHCVMCTDSQPVLVPPPQKAGHAQVQGGDLYIHIAKPDEDAWGCVHEALQRGAAAVIASEAFEAEEDMEVPVMLLPDCLDAQQRLAIAYFDNPSTKMTVVGVTGKPLCKANLLHLQLWHAYLHACKWQGGPGSCVQPFCRKLRIKAALLSAISDDHAYIHQPGHKAY